LQTNSAIAHPLGIRLWPSELENGRYRSGEGYTFCRLENSSDSYRFTAVSAADRIPGIVRSFAECLPEEAFLILEFYQEIQGSKEDDPPAPTVFYSPYLPTGEIIDVLETFLPRLVHDGFVGFGLANNRAGMELFYSEEKILTCFTGNHIRVMDLLARQGLRHVPDLLYPTDFGHDHLSLLCHNRESLPEPFASMTEPELDYIHFCGELAEQLDMYPVEESLSFFLSKKEQDEIEALLCDHEEFAEFAEEDFGTLLLDWNDFVDECETVFEGDLWEYEQGLRLRDMIEQVLQSVPPTLGAKILEIVCDSDARFKKSLVDRRKHLDSPCHVPKKENRFWYQGMVRNQGVYLRRDLIRMGWYNL